MLKLRFSTNTSGAHDARIRFRGAAVVAGSISVLVAEWCAAKPLSFVAESEHSSRAADCIERNDLTKRISRLSPRAVAIQVPREDSVHVVVRFDRVHDDYSARLSFFGAKPGVRVLNDRGPNCNSLGDAVVVAIAMLLDSEMDLDEAIPADSHHVESSLRIASASVRLKARSNLALPVQLSIQGGANWGFAPEAAAPSYEVGGGIVTRSGWLFELAAMGWLNQTSRYNVGEVSVNLRALALRTCHIWGTTWQLAPCAAMAVGRLHGQGRGFDQSAPANLLWTATGGSLVLDREIAGPLRVALHGMAWIPLTVQSMAIRDLGTAWEPSPIWFGIAIRVACRFY